MVTFASDIVWLADETAIPGAFAPSVVIKVPNVLGRMVNVAPPKMLKPV